MKIKMRDGWAVHDRRHGEIIRGGEVAEVEEEQGRELVARGVAEPVTD